MSPSKIKKEFSIPELDILSAGRSFGSRDLNSSAVVHRQVFENQSHRDKSNSDKRLNTFKYS